MSFHLSMCRIDRLCQVTKPNQIGNFSKVSTKSVDIQQMNFVLKSSRNIFSMLLVYFAIVVEQKVLKCGEFDLEISAGNFSRVSSI